MKTATKKNWQSAGNAALEAVTVHVVEIVNRSGEARIVRAELEASDAHRYADEYNELAINSRAFVHACNVESVSVS